MLLKWNYDNHKFLKLFMIGAFAIGGALFPFHEIKAQGTVIAAETPILTQEDATTHAKLLNLIPDGVEITSVMENKGEKVSWSVSFLGPEKNKEGNLQHGGEVVLLAADGSLISYVEQNGGDYNGGMIFDDKEEKVSREQALPIAEAFIKQQNWQLDGSWILNPEHESAYSLRDFMPLHKIRYNRAENGIPVDQQEFNIFIDRITGKVVIYTISWYKITFAPSDPIISKKAAGDIFFNIIQPDLFNSNEAGTSNLVYASNESYTLNATDGKYPEIYNRPPTKIDKALKPKIPAECAKKLLLSMYDIKLKYLYGTKEPLGLYYQLVLKPSVPIFYTGPAPRLDAKSGIWRDFLGAPVTQTMPAASDWLNEILYSPANIKYKAAIALNGKVLPLSDEPIITEGSTLVPFRGLFENMQAKLTWDPVSKKVTAKTDNITIELTINSKTAYVNGKAYQLSVPAKIVNNRTYIPARFTAQALGATVAWEAASRLVIINTAADKPRIETEHSLMLLRVEAQQNWDAKHLKHFMEFSEDYLASLNVTLPVDWKMDTSQKVVYDFINAKGENGGSVLTSAYDDSFDFGKPNHSSIIKDEYITVPLGKCRLITLDSDNGSAASGLTGTHNEYYAVLPVAGKINYTFNFTKNDKELQTKEQFIEILKSLSLK